LYSALAGERFGSFGWPTVARMDDGPDDDLGYPSTVELADGSLLTVSYQKAAARGRSPRSTS